MKSREALRLMERRQEITKPGNIWFKFDSNLNRKVSISRPPNKRRRNEVAAIDQELLFRINETNRWGGGYFEFNKRKANSSMEQKVTNPTEQNKIKAEPASIIEDSEVAKSSSNFPLVNLKDYDIAKGEYIIFKSTICLKNQKKRASEPRKT